MRNFANGADGPEFSEIIKSCLALEFGAIFFDVRLTVKCDYAARAVLGLARRYASGKAVRVVSLAKEQSIPQNYLLQILIELKTFGIVRSQRGKDGGYLLARAPEEITLADVLQCVHGRIFEPSGGLGCPPELRESWLRIQGALEEASESIHFRQIAESAKQEPEMYYI